MDIRFKINPFFGLTFEELTILLESKMQDFLPGGA